MTPARAVTAARCASLNSEVLRGVALATIRRAEELGDELAATRAAIDQRRRWERAITRASARR